MIIQKINDHLWVTSNIYFDNKCCFCGRPYVLLVAHKDSNHFWDANTIGIAIHDDDDFDIKRSLPPKKKPHGKYNINKKVKKH